MKHMPNFSINNLECVRRNNILFQGLNITIKDGELLQINGENGSGKSTLLQICSGLLEPSTGEILWCNKNIKKYRYEFHNNISYLGHTNAIKAALTIEENMKVMHALTGTKSKIDYSLILEKIGMPNMNNVLTRDISTGQKRRVGLTRLFISESKLWFLDEPFSALDPLIRKEMQDEFLRLQGVLNKTILFVTHDFDEALRLADRIAIMKEGVIEQLDTPANIVLSPATEYVRKFTEEVPREKVLKIESVMDPIVDSSEKLSDLKVSKDAMIETVAEVVLSEQKPVAVVDANNKVVGTVRSSKVIHVLFGSRAETKNSG